MNDILSKISKSIIKADTIALYCHINPDGDTLASALALYDALTSIGKSVAVFCENALPAKYAVLKHSDKVSFPDKITRDLAIAVDCSDLDRLGSTMRSFLSARNQIAVDHHKSHAKFADITLIDSAASATGEIVYKLLLQMKLINDIVAELLFAAIVADSGCFSFSNTTLETHKIASDLLTYNFNASSVIYNIQKKQSKKVFELKHRVLAKARFFDDNTIAILPFLQADFAATDTESNDTEGIITNLIDIDTVKVAFAVSEAGEKSFKISIRTKGEIDASDCASAFGGGGHRNAAGCRLNGYFEDVVDKLIKAARDRF